MCLLIAMFSEEPKRPLVVAANRDERYSRVATPMALRSRDPRILSGRDEFAGGTWLAVNEYGVVAALTNQPTGAGRDPTKHSRGELPLIVAAGESADIGVQALLARIDPSTFNPCWMLVGDRSQLFSLEIGPDRPVRVEELGPGRYVLENGPLGVPTRKSEFIKAHVQEIPAHLGDDELAARLIEVLSDHTVPPLLEQFPDPLSARRGPERLSACVHSSGYGTRSSSMVFVADDQGLVPSVRFADGAPCVSAMRDLTSAWSAASVE